MSVSRRDLLRWQFDLTWSLFEYHLERLDEDDVLWEASALSWTVRRGDDDGWRPDWQDTEPEPVPVPTIGWLTWHIGWWWTVTIDHAEGKEPPAREAVTWPGTGAAAVEWLRGLRERWLAVLSGMADDDLDRPASFPWPDDSEMTLAHTLAWVNAELMKNAAEIGQVRLLRAAAPS